MSKPKQLANGTLEASAGSVIYTVPRGKILSLRVALFHNSSGGARIVRVFFNFNGDALQVDYASLASHESLLIESGHILEEGHTIEAYQDTGRDVNYTLSGLLMDA